MTDLSGSRVLNLDGREIIVRELTVAGVRQMLLPNASGDVLGAALFEENSHPGVSIRLVDDKFDILEAVEKVRRFIDGKS